MFLSLPSEHPEVKWTVGSERCRPALNMAEAVFRETIFTATAEGGGMLANAFAANTLSLVSLVAS